MVLFAVPGFCIRAAAVPGGCDNQVYYPRKWTLDFDFQTFYVRARIIAFSQE